MGVVWKVVIDYLQGIFNEVDSIFYFIFWFSAIILQSVPSLIIDFFNSISAKLKTLKNKVPATDEEGFTMSNINTPNDKNDGSLAKEMEISLEKDINEEEAVNDVAPNQK